MNKKPEFVDLKSTPIARGSRLKTARLMTGLTRNAFEKKYGLSASTIQSWEAAKAGGLTTRGATQVVQYFHKEGVMCSTRWLLYGMGPPPQFIWDARLDQNNFSTIDYSNNSSITQELLTFRSMNGNTLDFVVNDDGMEPYYSHGDFVAGIRRRHNEIYQLVGLDCIIHTKENITLVRRIQRQTSANHYNLICTNLRTTVDFPILYAQELLFAAPIIWHRKLK